MLKTRVLTAVVLLAVFLPGLFFLSQAQWAIVVAVIAGLAGWEWGALIRRGARGRVVYGALVAALCLALTGVAPESLGIGDPAAPAAPWTVALYATALMFWLLIVPVWLRNKWTLAGSPLAGLAGMVVIVPAWLALVQLRLLGPTALLALLAIVWIADIAAYFSGKAFGRRKLAPSISPGKTWEGVFGAAIAVVAYGLAIRETLGYQAVSLPLWIGALILATGVSVVGDLFESMLKRQVGLKDSSNILPGHGGILDRIDSLTSTLPTVAALWLIHSLTQA